MTLETIRGNIDRKIDRLIKQENKSLEEVNRLLIITKNNFEKLLNADVNSSARLHMMTMYVAFSEKRIKDFQYVSDYLSTCSFFAGASDENMFKLIKFRDKVSQDVIESELY
jgi:predicted XRE-type DNA-binding protein